MTAADRALARGKSLSSRGASESPPREAETYPPTYSLFPYEMQPAPHPIPGCGVCSALREGLSKALDQASPLHDTSWAADLRIEMRNHPHAEPLLSDLTHPRERRTRRT